LVLTVGPLGTPQRHTVKRTVWVVARDGGIMNHSELETNAE
jgi:hypothetical protein